MKQRIVLLALLLSPLAAGAVETDVNLRVRGMIVRGEVTQRFRNPYSTCMDAVYEFPLPEDAAVDSLRMKIGQRVIEGEIQERKKAEETFDTAKKEGRKASRVAQERPNIFTASIASIGAGEEVRVTIEYQQNVAYQDGAFRLRFPMTIGPRFMGVTPSVNPASNNRLNLTVDLDSGFTLRQIDSTYHKIESTVLSASHYRIALRNTIADRDFELVWQADIGSEPKSALFAENEYALLMLMPPSIAHGERMPKESIFIVDTSGSMEGTSLNEAKSALQLALDRLEGQDRFNIIQFNSVTETLFNDAQPATPQAIAQAKHWVQGLEATGGTVMLPALETALREASTPENVVRQVIFMTDGQAGNESECFAVIRAKLGRSRLFTVGIGAAPNSHFMRQAARFGRGTFTYIGDSSEVQDKMSALFAKLESPVMTNVELRFDDPAAEVMPQRIPDLYAGEPLVVAVRFANRGGRLIASAKRGSEEWHEVMNVQAKAEGAGTLPPTIARLWARRKIEALSDSGTDVQQEILQLALQHHLVSQYTSLVAVDVTPSTRAEKCETSAVPVNLPAGWGGIEGSLPGTSTIAPLSIISGLLLIAAALVLRLRSES